MDAESKIAELNRRFSLPGLVHIVAGQGGLPKIQIEGRSAKAEIYLHGAQITSWVPAGAGEVLFVSAQSHWQDGKAIRGGIPICFPWFRGKTDDPTAPTHGFGRTREWRLDSLTAADEDGVCVRLSTVSDDASRKWWPFEFHVDYAITVSKSLKLELSVANTGDRELRFEEALHTYFMVGDMRNVRVAGLDGVAYLDNRDQNREKMQHGDLVLSRQTDNAYRKATGAVEIVDPVRDRRLVTRKENSASTIVWNPWSDGAAGLTDFGNDEWQRMLCVEGGNIMDSAVTLKPSESHTIRIIIQAIPERP